MWKGGFIFMSTNIEVYLNEIFSYIKLASLYGLTEEYKGYIIKSFKSYQKKLNDHYIPKGYEFEDDGRSSRKYQRAYLTVADVILAKNAIERKKKAREGIDSINYSKKHFTGEQSKIIKFFKKIRKANDDEVGTDLSKINLKITDRIQTETSYLNEGNLNKIKSGSATMSINIKR